MKLHLRIYLFIAFLVLSSCFLFNPIMAQTENLNLESEKCFNIFWTEFREAVIKCDTTKLVILIHFPLKVSGERDEDSVMYLRKDNFIPYYRKFLLNTSFFIEGRYITNFEYIRITKTPKKATIFQETETWKRIGDLEFEKIKNKWGLTLIYCHR